MSSASNTTPRRDDAHGRLAVFLGDWKAEGTSFGGTDQTGDDPKVNGVKWSSTHTGRWHTGEFFLVQDERACIGEDYVFDTLSIVGVDPDTGRYCARSFENHGYYRNYDLSVNKNVWSLDGEFERARIVFSDDCRTQTITWEWKPADRWLPLCDRTAIRTG